MQVEKKLLNFKNQIEKDKQERSIAQGQKKEILSNLKKMDLDSDDQAYKKVKKLQAKLKRLDVQIIEQVEHLEESYEWQI